MPPKRGAAKGAAKKLVPDKLRRDNNNFYHFYRKGELKENARRKVKLASQRENLLLNHGVVPDEVFPYKTNEGLQGYDEYYAELDEESEKEDEERDKKDEKAEKPKWETSKGLTKDMYEKGAGLHFCKILGAGGMGIICVFVSYENQTPTFWTVKRDIKPYQAVASEKETTLRFLRAPHIVQVFHRYEEEDRDDDNPRRSKRARTGTIKARSQAEVRKESRATRAGQRVASIARKAGTAVRQPQVGPTDQVDQVPNSMVMEYVIRGTLDNWFEGLGKLKAAREPDLRIPNRVLWAMMACFMKMCMAMEYHPLQENVSDDGKMIPENTPATSAQPGTGLVHFDIDPQNVLIGHFDSETRKGKVAPTHPQFEAMTDAHDRTPIFKLIDFGLAREMKFGDPYRSNPELLWGHRQCGKPGYYLPEQFTREWEAVVDSPDDQHARVAGQYSWKSNLWQFGLIMHIAITLRWNPSLTIHALRDEDLIYGPPNDLPLRRQTKRSYPTYGAHLLDPQYDHVPFRLRHLVARCLCEIPDDRPSFEEIRAEIQWAWDGESPEEMEAAKQWSQTRFERPPPPVTPPWMKVEEWAKQTAILSFDEYLEKYPVK